MSSIMIIEPSFLPSLLISGRTVTLTETFSPANSSSASIISNALSGVLDLLDLVGDPGVGADEELRERLCR